MGSEIIILLINKGRVEVDKKNIFLDFNLFILDSEQGEDDYFPLEPNKEAVELLKSMNFCYQVFIFTERERQNVYKWFIRHHLDSYIQDVVCHKDPKSLLLTREFLKFQDEYTEQFWK